MKSVFFPLNKTNFLYPAITGTLLALSFVPFNLYPLIFVAFLPLLHCLNKSTSAKKAFFAGYFSGFVFFSILLYWLLFLFRFSSLAPFAYIFAVAFSALFFGFFGVSVFYFKNLLNSKYLYLIPFVFVVVEHLRSVGMFSFTWGQLGYALAKVPFLIQFADIFGIYGVSFWIITINVILFALFINRRTAGAKKIIVAFFAVAIIPIAYGGFRWNYYDFDESLNVSVIQPNIDQGEKWNPEASDKNFKTLMDLTKQAIDEGSRLIVWPEASLVGSFVGDKTGLLKIKALAGSAKTAMLVGALTPADDTALADDFYNSAVFIKDDFEPQIYNKIKLVLITEHFPFRRFIPDFFMNKIDSMSSWIGKTVSGINYTVFNLPESSFGATICFESTYTDVARQLRLNGANFLVNITNDAWFGSSFAAEQHASFLVMRAIENRMSVLQSANTGISGFVDPMGRFNGRIGLLTRGQLTQKVPLTSRLTFYSRYGNWFVWLLWIVIIATFLLFFADHRKRY